MPAIDKLEPSAPLTIRDRTILFLLFLTSEPCIKSAQRFISGDRLAFELCRMWFDDIYWPGPRYLEGLKGDLTADRITEFSGHFSEDELESLQRFHAFFELRIDMLSKDSLKHRRFPESDMWANIVRDATYLVELLEPNAERPRRFLEWLASAISAGDSGPLLQSGRLALPG
jgi:hypothetical protein